MLMLITKIMHIKMDLKKIGRENVDWIRVSLDTVNMVMDLKVHKAPAERLAATQRCSFI
jgi:hypothetical protein